MCHDTDALRNFGNDMISNEVKRLNKADIVILHNPKMEMKLRELGLKNKVVNIELFDYLLNEAIPQKIYVLNKEIAFAGNLGKSEFLKNKELKKLRTNLICMDLILIRSLLMWKMWNIVVVSALMRFRIGLKAALA